MSYEVILHSNDTAAIEAEARVLFGASTEKVLKECGGSARALIESSRTKNGRGWNHLRAAQSLHTRAVMETLAQRQALTSPRVAREFLSKMIGTLTYEVFVLCFLDNRHRLVSTLQVFRGTVDGASVHPREVVREALRVPACAAVLAAHVHPSGVAEPSQADEVISQRLKDALALVDIRLVDHLVITGDIAVSLAERGLL